MINLKRNKNRNPVYMRCILLWLLLIFFSVHNALARGVNIGVSGGVVAISTPRVRNVDDYFHGFYTHAGPMGAFAVSTSFKTWGVGLKLSEQKTYN